MINIHNEIIVKIIREQEKIIGPLAVEEANKVPGLVYDPNTNKVDTVGNANTIIDHLIEQYKKLFGQASVEVCKDAAIDLITKIPEGNRPSMLIH